ncbi:MAG: glutathione S-transferase [Sneathiella sp.]|nr:glutathione S-transferase [Sneathiella sp.]
MTRPLLVLGNKRYSSWSLRGYLALKLAGLDFDETVIPLFQEDTHAKIKKLAPNAPARVPLLLQDGYAIWDTMSLMEYAADISIKGPLWPEDKYARAHARSISAEMHAGFEALRGAVPMNLSRNDSYVRLSDDVETDIDRITSIWKECRTQHASTGPFLFGAISMADVAFAPVVVRLKSKGYPVDDICGAYMKAIWDLPEFAEWRAAAEKEQWIIEQ